MAKELREYTEDGGLRLNLHPGQLAAWNSVARFIAIIAGHQSGKTSFGPHWLMREIATKGQGDYIVVTPSFPLLEAKALPEFLEVFERKGKLGSYSTSGAVRRFTFTEAGQRFMFGDGRYDPDKQTVVFFGHADAPQSLEAFTAKGGWFDEAGQKRFRQDSWEALQRRLSIHRGRAILTTTPYDLGWLKTEIYDRWKSGDPDYDVINFPSTANPKFSPEEAARMKRTLPPWKYDMFVLGLFSKPAGLIYDCFTDERNTTKMEFPPPPNWKRVIGIDFGGINTAAVYLARDPMSSRFYQYGEYYPRRMLTARGHAVAMMENQYGVRVDKTPGREKVFYDKNLYTLIGGTRSEAQWRLEFYGSGLEIGGNLTPEVEIGIDRVYAQVALGNMILMLPSAKLTKDEFNSYSREVDSQGEPIPNTIEDKSIYHLLDAVRYAVSYIGDPNPDEGWTEEDLAKLDPEGYAVNVIRNILGGDVDLDSPQARAAIRRYQREAGKQSRLKKDRDNED